MSTIQLPSHISQALTVCRYELLKFLRGKKILGILAITIVIAIPVMIMPEVADTQYPPNIEEFLSLPLSLAFFLIVLSALFFGGDSLITEFHQRTGYSLFTNPVSRISIWGGKFLAAELVSFLFIGLYYGIISLGAFVIYDQMKYEMLSSLGISLVVLTMIMSLAFLISSSLRGPTGAAILIFFLFIVILPMFDQLLMNVMETKFILGLAACAHMMEDYEQAVKHYLTCGMMDPNSPIPFYHASDCFIKLDDIYSAMISLSTVVERSGEKPEYVTMKNRCEVTLETFKEKVKKGEESLKDEKESTSSEDTPELET